MNRKEMTIDKCKISYIDTEVGSNIAVVLHGWGANLETVVPIINILKDSFRVVSLDSPGFGLSEDPSRVYGTEDYADFTVKFLQELGIENADFLGHSFGGKTITVIAAKYPNLVKRAVLIDASGVLPKRELQYYFKVYSFKLLKFLYTRLLFWKDREKSLEKFYKKFGSEDYKAAQGIMRKSFVKVVNESTTEFFKDINAETLLIWGENDEDTPLYMAKEFESGIKNSGLVILKGGHYSYLDDYGTFSAVINSFLR